MGKQYNKLSNIKAALNSHSVIQRIVEVENCEHHLAIQLLAENVEDFEAAPTTFLEVYYSINGSDRLAHFFAETELVLVFHVDEYWFDEEMGSEYEIEMVRVYQTEKFFQMLQSVLNEYDYALMMDPSLSHGLELLNEFAEGDSPTAQ